MFKKPKPIVSASLLSSDFARIGDAIDIINSSGAQWIHFDVMDGQFVPPITFGHKMVKDCRGLSTLPFDVHLMIVKPENHIDEFADAGADHITIHSEASVHLHRLVMRIKELGKMAGVSIVPSTPVEDIREILPFLDIVLIMTVNPGFGGQTMIMECLKKVEYLNELRIKMGYNYFIEIDGGVNIDTANEAFKAGTDVLVTGSSFFKSQDRRAFVKEVLGKAV
jgi:ribulose-phosphate 3-epimerase